jgi:hypothetical protein
MSFPQSMTQFWEWRIVDVLTTTIVCVTPMLFGSGPKEISREASGSA